MKNEYENRRQSLQKEFEQNCRNVVAFCLDSEQMARLEEIERNPLGHTGRIAYKKNRKLKK
jgi:hypothetical protein